MGGGEPARRPQVTTCKCIADNTQEKQSRLHSLICRSPSPCGLGGVCCVSDICGTAVRRTGILHIEVKRE